jgi:hypothetical protein
VKRILFVAMMESVHVARWISPLQDPARGHPCVSFVFAFDDAGASARSYTLLGGQQQNPEVGGHCTLFCSSVKRGAGTLPYWGPFTSVLQ